MVPSSRPFIPTIKGRVIDADFYRANLKALYPDWEFTLDDSAEKSNNKEGEK